MFLHRLLPLVMPSSPSAPSTSVIIPTYNESSTISATISTIRSHASTRFEIIVVDGHSRDSTCHLARRAGATTVLSVRGGRSAQLNAGAARATAPTLLFLHADTAVPQRFDAEIAATLANPRVVAGAFRLRIASDIFGIRFVETIANWRARWLQRPYGDQGLFMTKERFAQVDGYPDMPFLDDYVMVGKIARWGRIGVSNAVVTTSGRRWETLGVVQTTIMNQLVIGAYHLGVPVERLRNWYRSALQRAVTKTEARRGKVR